MLCFYVSKGCDWTNTNDPLKKDQLVPWVMSTLFYLAGEKSGGYMPLLGLYVAALYAASLSTISSMLNAMALLTLSDIAPLLGIHLKPEQKMKWSKLAVLFSGIAVLGAGLVISTKIGKAMNSIIILLGLFKGPLMGLVIMSILKWFHFLGQQSMKIAVVSGVTMSVMIGLGRFYDPMPAYVIK